MHVTRFPAYRSLASHVRLLLGVSAMLSLLLFTAPAKAESNGIVLIQDRAPAAVIVLADSANRRSVEQAAAEILAASLERMAGVRLEIKRERELGAVHVDRGWIMPGTPGDAIAGEEDVPGEAAVAQAAPINYILVGESGLTRELGITAGELGVGGLRLTTSGNAVVLLGGPRQAAGQPGADRDGVQHAVIELLGRLGCDYLWPGEVGMVIPRRDRVVVESIDFSYTPRIRGRGIRWAGPPTTPRPASGLEQLQLTLEQWQAGYDRAMGDALPVDWPAWQRLGGEMPAFGHAGGGLRNAEYHLEHHPEWFALQADGTRDQAGDPRYRLCISNPDLIQHVANDIIQQLNDDPSIQIVSLDPNDGGSRTGWCLCENCEALDPADAPRIQVSTYPTRDRRQRESIEHASLTDRFVHYWSSIAERVTAVHPNVLFGVSAYSAFSHPPVQQKLHPNLVVRYVPAHTDFVPGWKAAGTRQMYWRPNILLAPRRDGKLRSIVGDLAEHMRYFADAGIIQTDFDSIQHHWAIFAPSYYAAARLTWDPYLTADQIIADFASHGFGAGAPFIERYIHRIEALTPHVTGAFQSADDRTYTPEVLAELRQLLNDAEQAANDPQISERVAFLRMGLNFTELQETLDEMSWRARQKMDVDRKLAQRLVDLNSLMLRDILLKHNVALSSSHLVWATGTFARFSPVGGRTVTPSDPALLKRLDDPAFGLTGREQSLADMLAAFGL